MSSARDLTSFQSGEQKNRVEIALHCTLEIHLAPTLI